MPTIEEMKATLESAGYRHEELIIGSSLANMWLIGDVTTTPYYDYDKAMKVAYAHYLQQKRYAEMEALLQEIVDTWKSSVGVEDINALHVVISLEYAKFVISAKAILAEKEAS